MSLDISLPLLKTTAGPPWRTTCVKRRTITVCHQTLTKPLAATAVTESSCLEFALFAVNMPAVSVDQPLDPRSISQAVIRIHTHMDLIAPTRIGIIAPYSVHPKVGDFIVSHLFLVEYMNNTISHQRNILVLLISKIGFRNRACKQIPNISSKQI